MTALISGRVLCLGVCVASGAVPRARVWVLLRGGARGADGRLPVSGCSILPGHGHSTGWDQLLAHCAKDGFAG